MNNNELIRSESQNFIEIFNSISDILRLTSHSAQSNFILSLVDLLKESNLNEFSRLINSDNMWGGAGAVWEVYIENKDKRKEFNEKMIQLINLMQKVNIDIQRANSVRMIFE